MPTQPALRGDAEDRYATASESVDRALSLSREKGIGDVDGDDDAAAVVVVLGAIVAARKVAEDERKAIVGPLNADVRRINNRFKELTGPLDGAERALKDAVARYRRKVEAARRERIMREERNRRDRQRREDAKAEAEHREPVRQEAPRIEAEPEATLRSGGAAATVRKVWTFEIVDENAVPRHYCKPDGQAIKAAIGTGVREIDGVRIYEDDQVAVST